jgi:hypothetical protein
MKIKDGRFQTQLLANSVDTKRPQRLILASDTEQNDVYGSAVNVQQGGGLWKFHMKRWKG